MDLSKVIYALGAVICAMPFVDTPIALLTGIILAQTVPNPYLRFSKKLTHTLLQVSVVGLGFGMNAFTAMQAGKEGFVFTIFSIAITITMGVIAGRFMKVESKTSYLISTGTAVCGGSAIAAVSSIIKSNEKQISAALGTVFILNSVALFLFPLIGHFLDLSQHQFGLWAAIAIHDTSSVVGAANKYGAEALQTATTVKLERALWIIPIGFFSIFIFKSESKKIKVPYFIFLFVLAMVINTLFPIKEFSNVIVSAAKMGLKITLFLIGAGLSKELIKSVGYKPFIQGLFLWTFISVFSLFIIIHFVL